jgi:hypothetical protein
MKFEGLEQCSQEPAAGSHPEPDKPSLCTRTLFMVYCPIVYVQVFQVIFSFQVFRLKYCIYFSALICLLHTLLIS